MDVWTPINGHQWPVSIPKDADLNLIRIEMLNMGLEYVWLDVLCLRQKGGLREDLLRRGVVAGCSHHRTGLQSGQSVLLPERVGETTRCDTGLLRQ